MFELWRSDNKDPVPLKGNVKITLNVSEITVC